MSGRPHYIEEARALSLTRGVCRECSEPWPKGASACPCGASIVAFVSAPVIADLAETVEHLHAEIARITRALTVQTSRGDGAEAAEVRLTKERDALRAAVRSAAHKISTAFRMIDIGFSGPVQDAAHEDLDAAIIALYDALADHKPAATEATDGR